MAPMSLMDGPVATAAMRNSEASGSYVDVVNRKSEFSGREKADVVYCEDSVDSGG